MLTLIWAARFGFWTLIFTVASSVSFAELVTRSVTVYPVVFSTSNDTSRVEAPASKAPASTFHSYLVIVWPAPAMLAAASSFTHWPVMTAVLEADTNALIVLGGGGEGWPLTMLL